MRLGILEDEPTQIAIYELMFPPTQYQCEFFRTIASFLEAIKEKNFDLLVLDWMLPDGTAGEALKWIRENLSWHIPIICVTSRNSEADVVNVLHMGADDYFVKSSRHFELFASYLFQNQNKLLSRIHLLEKIWRLSAEIDTRTANGI